MILIDFLAVAVLALVLILAVMTFFDHRKHDRERKRAAVVADMDEHNIQQHKVRRADAVASLNDAVARLDALIGAIEAERQMMLYENRRRTDP